MDVRTIVSEVRSTYVSGRTKPLSWRLANLVACRKMLEDNIEAWTAAVEADTLKPRAEAQIGDVWVAQQEINTMIRSVQAWMQPEHVATPAALVPASSRIEKQPFGVTLGLHHQITGQLALCPLFGAIAAGNACVLKPSEQCPEVAQCLEAFVKAYLDPEAVRVLQGGAGMVQALLAERWDHIIFTGSERVGRIVAAAAAAHLTPTTLELGGKCPVFVADDVTEPIESIAYKLLWGRLLSGGQSCVAPSTCYCPRGSCVLLPISWWPTSPRRTGRTRNRPRTLDGSAAATRPLASAGCLWATADALCAEE